MTKLYQPHYDNGEAWSDHYEWVSEYVYATEEEAIAEILSRGYLDLGATGWKGEKWYSFDNGDCEYGQERLGIAYVKEITLGGDTDGAEILRKAGK